MDKKTSMFSIFLFVIFLYPILPQYIYLIGNINVVNGLLLAFCAVYLVFYGRIAKPKTNNIILFYWLFVFAMAISYFVDAGILKMATYIMSFIIFPWFIVSVVNTEERFIKTIDVLILAGAFIGVLGILEAIFKVNFIQIFANEELVFFHDIRYGLLRIMTTFGQPISYGLYQVFIVALINYRMNVSGGRKGLRICYIISVINIILTVSRLPIIAFIIMQILLAYRKSKRKFLNYVVIVGIIVFFAMIVGTSMGIKIPLIDDSLETINQLITGDQTSTSDTVGVGDRLNLWTWVYLSMGNNWIYGHGPTAEFAYEVYWWQTKTSIENQYLHVLWHNGLVGIILLILSYVSILIFSSRRKNNFMNKLREKVSFNTVVFVTMIVYYVVELGVQESDMARIYTVFIGLLIAYSRIVDKKRMELVKEN